MSRAALKCSQILLELRNSKPHLLEKTAKAMTKSTLAFLRQEDDPNVLIYFEPASMYHISSNTEARCEHSASVISHPSIPYILSLEQQSLVLKVSSKIQTMHIAYHITHSSGRKQVTRIKSKIKFAYLQHCSGKLTPV